MDFLNFTFNLHFHFWFWKPNSQKLSKGRSAVFSLPHIADELKEGSLYSYNFEFVKHPTRWSRERRRQIFSRPHFNWILSVGCPTKHPHYSLSSSEGWGLVRGHLITKLQVSAVQQKQFKFPFFWSNAELAPVLLNPGNWRFCKIDKCTKFCKYTMFLFRLLIFCHVVTF